MHYICVRSIVIVVLLLSTASTMAQFNLVQNPSFGDPNGDTLLGDNWGVYGAADFNEFFGAGNPHASLFADQIGNFGGVYQLGIPAAAASEYLFRAENVRIEANFDGELRIAVEFYSADDSTKLGESVRIIPGGLTGDGLVFNVSGIAPIGTAFVRPLISFDNVQTTGGTERNVFIFDAFLAEIVPGTNLLFNGGFEDVNGGDVGDGWGSFENVSFNTFFGAKGHASLYGDLFSNFGGIFQLGIPGTPGETYHLHLTDVRIESAWDADLYAGFEYYDANDVTKLGESLTLLDTATRVAQGRVDGNAFSVMGTAVPGTAIVRPIVRFDNVNETYFFTLQANTFIFDSFMSLAPLPGDEYTRNPGFGDLNGDGTLGDQWDQYGSAGINEFFGAGNAHASLFADLIGNSGGVFQQNILATPGSTYRFDLLDVRVEANFDADLFFGLEFFADDDFTKIGESITQVDTSTTGDGLSFSTLGVAPIGTVYVRPIIFFDNVGTDGGSDRNVFVFAVALTELPLAGDYNGDGMVDFNDAEALLSCLAGPENSTTQACLDAFDVELDGDVDMADAAAFAELLVP
jgi:hypothetical protein